MSQKQNRLVKRTLSFIMAVMMVCSVLLQDSFAVTANAAGTNAPKNSFLLEVGNRVKLSAPSGKTTWRSDNTGIATVYPDGTVVGLSEGNAIITATTKSTAFLFWGTKVTETKYYVTVFEPEVEQVQNHAYSIKKGETLALNVEGSNARWSTSDRSVVSVSSGGMATAKREGTATVTAVSYKTTWKHFGWLFAIFARTERIVTNFTITVLPNGTPEPTVPHETEPSVPVTNEYTVTFDSNGGSHVETQVVKENEKVQIPSSPERDGYEFDGWYSDENLENSFNFENKVTGSIILYAKWKEVEIGESIALFGLAANETNYLVGYESGINFTVNTQNIPDKVITLRNDYNPELIFEMNDDGTNGDRIANDGIYSCIVDIDVTEFVFIHFFAECAGKRSNIETLYFFDINNTEENEKAEIAIEVITNLIDTIDGSNKEQVFISIKDYIEQLKENNTVIKYEINSDNIIVKFSNGIPVVFTPFVDGVDLAGDDNTIITMQPCYSMYDSDISDYLRMPDAAATDVANMLGNFDFSGNYDNGGVSLNQIKNLSTNQLILWHGHGNYSSKNHSYLLTGEYYSGWSSLNPFLFADLIKEVILTTDDNRIIITPKYIDKYCGRMDGSVVYLAACKSGKDSTLAQAFLNKGAVAVVASTDSIYTKYNLLVMHSVITKMTEINPETSDYYTLSEALDKAKESWGSTDIAWAINRGETELKEETASIYILGGTAAENVRLTEVGTGSISGKVCKAADRATPITTANIVVNRRNQDVAHGSANGTGNYNIEVKAGSYTVDISAEGYIGFTAYATVAENENTYLETFLMVEGEEGTYGIASGTVKNALTGSGIADVNLTVRSGWNNDINGEILATATTSANGTYSFDLPLGNYTVCAEKDGYISTFFNIVVQTTSTGNQNGTMTPIVSGDNFRVVLTWGQNPSDLDSHVVGTLNNGDSFHVYYGHKSQFDGSTEVCNLDVDDTTSYGPETITLNVTSSQPYYYYIYKYAGTGTVAASGAQIKVYQGENLVATYNVPTDQGGNNYWNVFAIVDGTLVTRNTITSSAELNYASTSRSPFAALALDDEHTIEDDRFPAKEEPATEESEESDEENVIEQTEAIEETTGPIEIPTLPEEQDFIPDEPEETEEGIGPFSENDEKSETEGENDSSREGSE